MTLDEYQAAALTTAQWHGDELIDLTHWALGVTGEAGEIAEKVKKIIRDAKGEVSAEAKQEIIEEKRAITTRLLEADRKRAQEVLIQLQYQFSRKVTSIEIK